MKFVVKNKLKSALVRSRISNPVKVATILLDTFVNLNGKLKLDHLKQKNLCIDDNSFTKWRNELRDKGYLSWDYFNNGKHISYSPGNKLVKYINEEKIRTKEMVSMDDMKHELSGYVKKEEFNELQSAIKLFINQVDPYYTPEKGSKFLRGGYGHLRTVSYDEVEKQGLG